MDAELVIAREAHEDIGAAYGWYERRRRGLGEESPSAVEACFNRIARQPRIHSVVFQRYRRALVRRFPYAVFYESSAGRVTVYGVLHTARDPEKWQRRLKGQ